MRRQHAPDVRDPRRLLATLMGFATRLPYRLAHAWYHAAMPYERRLIIWEWRRRTAFQLHQLRQNLRPRLVRASRDTVRQILERHPDARGVVIFPPSAPWYGTLFARSHQMAKAFAALGYLVLYWVEEIDQSDERIRFREVAERLYLCKVPLAALRVCRRPLVVCYTYNYSWARLLRSPIVIYELIDHLALFTNFPARMLRRAHRQLLRRATLVVGTATDLLNELKASRPDAILCPNGVDLDHFTGGDGAPASQPDDLRTLLASDKPIIGYYGALAEWFDFDLLKYAATAMPDCQFVLIGPDYDGLTMPHAGLAEHPNIHWLGPKPYDDLPVYLRAFSVATIPFRVTEVLQAVSPVKVFEYMAGGRPIVTTDLAECRKYPVVRIAKTPQEWVERLREALLLRDDEALRIELRRTAAANTWLARAQQIIDALGSHSSGGLNSP